MWGFWTGLMNLVGELVLTRNQVLQFNAAHDDTVLNGITHRLNLITAELQERVMKTRMQPVSRIFNQFPRVVRDLATSLNKQIALEVAGAETELDRTLVDAIKDPLTHIVRNSCDHGIEPPEERLPARQTGRRTSPSARFPRRRAGQYRNCRRRRGHRSPAGSRQDGRTGNHERRTGGAPFRSRSGQPGLPAGILHCSSSHQSLRARRWNGRRAHPNRSIGGTVDLLSRPGQGTTLLIRIPLTLAIVPGLLVNAGGERFVIPQVNLHELIRLEGDAARNAIEYVHATPVLRRRDALLPLADLCHMLKLPEATPSGRAEHRSSAS